MEVTVAGHAYASLPPERATLTLELGYEGGDKSSTLVHTTKLAQRIGAEFASWEHQQPSPTTWSAMLPISTRSWRPHSQEGLVMPMRYAASCEAKVKFRDFEALSRAIDTWGGVEGVRVSWVQWTLTEKRAKDEESAVLRRAVDQARLRATTMAQAAGFSSVRFLEVADEGMLSTGGRGGSQDLHLEAMRAGAPSGGGGVGLQPEDVELRATVHARFTTE